MKLQDLAHLRDQKQIRFKEEIVNGQQFTIVSYMIADTELWRIPNAVECRGITFNSNGICVSRPFEKFFSVGENENTQLHQVVVNINEIFEKKDGSLVHPILVDKEIFLKTKKSFYSDVANLANARITNNVRDLCKTVCKYDYTPIFEFTCDEYPIVLNYDNTDPFTLLAIRHNLTGEYLKWNEVIDLASSYQVPTVVKYELSIDEILDNIKNLKNFEGYVLTLTNGTRVKLKTAWYLANHRLKTAIRERDIAEMVVDELIDDIKISASAENLDLTPILKIEHQVVTELTNLQDQVLEIVNEYKKQNLTQKEVAIQSKNHPLFGLIMREFLNKDTDYITYWKKNFLPSYSLKCVYNQNF